MPLSAGSRLGPYEILSALGAGGMGEVYRARDTRLDRTVAVKILSDSLAVDQRFRERFDREARAISRLTHPNICILYDVGEQDGAAFLVMELLDQRQRRALRAHEFCFSLQVMQTRVHGMAFNRASAIGSPQSRQTP